MKSKSRKIYIASSWRNQQQNSVVRACRALGHEVYDFKNPEPNSQGFSWSQVDKDWKNWTPEQYVWMLLDSGDMHINKGFNLDAAGLHWCDTCILLLPCGRSAHLEAGYCIGKNKSTAVFISSEKFEPDLMYLLAEMTTDKMEKIYDWLGDARE